MKTKISIIILNWRQKKMLFQCLESIFKYYFPKKDFFEIIIMNNGASDNLDDLKKRWPFVKIINSQKNLGYGVGNNLASENACGEIFMFLNNDTKIITPKIFEEIYNFFQKNRRAGIVSPQLVLDDGMTPQSTQAGYIDSPFGLIVNKLLLLLKYLIKKNQFLSKINFEFFDWQRPAAVDWVSGAALCIRAKLYRRLKGFDSNFFMYYEDKDLCLRARKEGYQVWVLPDLKIVHLGGKSIKVPQERKKYYYQSQDYFFKKHFGLFGYLLIKIFSYPIRLINT